ncbi:MAG: hypothetical protein JWM57_1300 [Phycisphaerales bacterium]|nr:hypothetical protein [Phycisphaerales bacterium]
MFDSDFRRRNHAESSDDSGVSHPRPGTPRWDAQYGRGWTAAGMFGLAGFVAGGVVAAKARSSEGTVQGLAFAIASFAGLFLFGMIYLWCYRLGMGWQNGVIWPDEKPVKYALVTGTIAVLSIAAIALAVWAGFHPDLLARTLVRPVHR